jgi:hypothetical protein
MSSTTTSADELARAANVLGALSLAVVDRVHGAVAQVGIEGETSSAALSALHHFLDAPTSAACATSSAARRPRLCGWSTGWSRTAPRAAAQARTPAPPTSC